MSRKQWIVVGIILVVVFLVGVVFFRGGDSDPQPEPVQNAPVSPLGYCSEEDIKPCVVSFSVDAFENMLINILLPDLSFPNFYIRIAHSRGETLYACQRLGAALNSAYCAGEKLPPGEKLNVMLFSAKDDALLAQGELSLIGLALPTVGVAVSTPQNTATAPAGAPTPTSSPVFILPTPSETQSSYPNPSYP